MAGPPRTANLSPGRDGLAHFLQILGEEVNGWAFEHLVIQAESLELALVSAGQRASFELSLPRRDRPTRTSSRTLSVYPRGSRDGPKAYEQTLAEAVFARFSSTSFVDLLRRLRRDALLYSDSKHSAVPSRLDRHHRVSDHAPDWWKFFYPNARCLEQEVRLQGSVVRINHSTTECRFNNPQLPVRSLRYFTDERVERAHDDATYIDTAITESDVLAGQTMARLSGALAQAMEQQPAVLHLMTTCLPELIGDDPRPLLRKLEERSRVAICWSAKTGDALRTFDALIDRMLADIELAPERDARSVLLAGVPTAQSGQEARELLGLLGLEVVGELFPGVDLGGAPRAARAGAVVWLNPVGWEKIGNERFLQNGLAVVRFHPPFGQAGTRAWLERICQVLGRDPTVLEQLQTSSTRQLAELRERCRAHRIALVGDRADLDVMVTHGRALGMSVAALLCDMGFQVACLVHVPAGEGSIRRPPTPTGAGSLETISFCSEGELDALLGSDVDAAFTHFSHDPRLARWAVPGFCEDVFEVGYEGMSRSARRLLHLCETRPFPAQRRFLATEARDGD